MNQRSNIISPVRYSKYPGNPNRVYQALCHTLSGRIEEVDWDAFTEADWGILPVMAELEGVAPLIYWKFSASPEQKGKVPHPVFDALQTSYYQTLARNTLLFDELDRILTALGEAGIPVILLKGAALAQSLYEDIGLRPMNDIDIFVKSSQLAKCLDVLQVNGYSVEKITYHAVLIGGPQRKITIELHWSLIPGRMGVSSSSDLFWEYADRPTSLTTLYVLYSSAHLMLQHSPDERRLLWLYDLYTIVHRYKDILNWKHTVNTADKLGWGSALQRVAKELQVCFDCILPGYENYDLHAIGNPSKVTISQAQFNQLIFQNAIIGLDWPMRLRVIWFLFIPSKNYMLWRYSPKPTWLWRIYYPYRWVDLTRMAFTRIVRLSALCL